MKITVLTLAGCAAFAAIPGALLAQDTTTTPVPAPAAAPAQSPVPVAQPSNAISPGMSEADVRARWGDPVTVKTVGQWKYMYYRNGNERHVGWLDVVFLQGGQVVDCIARGAGHSYTGQSSSPAGRVPERTINPDAATNAPAATVTGVRISP